MQFDGSLAKIYDIKVNFILFWPIGMQAPGSMNLLKKVSFVWGEYCYKSMRCQFAGCKLNLKWLDI